MKKLAILILLVNVFSLLQGQDIIYTINCEKDGGNTNLDSILFENLSNDTRLLFEDLPIQNSYVVNLSTQEIETSTGIFDNNANEYFKLIKNIPGEIGILLKNKRVSDIYLTIYNLSGQKLYSQTINENEIKGAITVHIPNSGIYILNIHSTFGDISYKVMGSNNPGSIGYIFNQDISDEINIVFKQASFDQEGEFSFQIGDSLRIIAFHDGHNSYPIVFAIQSSEILNLLIETDPDKYMEINSIKYQLNMGYNVWLSELDCGSLDVFAHALHLTSDISVNKYEWDDGGKSLLPSGKGNMLVFGMYSKYSDLVPGQYVFVDNVDCNGMVTDDGNTYYMNDTDKYVVASWDIAFPTHYVLNLDLEIDWNTVDFDNLSTDVVNKWNNYINTMVGIKEGTVSINKDGDIYTITFDCTDPDGNVITGKYIGNLEFVEFGI